MSLHITTFILATLLITCLSSCNADLIGDVCGKAANPPSCDKILRSDPRGAQARDLPSLGFVVIDEARALSQSAQALVTSLAKTSDPKIKGSLSTCAENFGDAMGSLDDCKESLKKQDASSLNIQATAAYTNADTCNDDFEGLIEPENVKQATQNVIDACSALLALSNMLPLY